MWAAVPRLHATCAKLTCPKLKKDCDYILKDCVLEVDDTLAYMCTHSLVSRPVQDAQETDLLAAIDEVSKLRKRKGEKSKASQHGAFPSLRKL